MWNLGTICRRALVSAHDPMADISGWLASELGRSFRVQRPKLPEQDQTPWWQWR
jgi:hypothetical protein